MRRLPPIGAHKEREILRYLEVGKLVAALRAMVQYVEFLPDAEGGFFCPYCRVGFDTEQAEHDVDCLYRIVIDATTELECIDLRPARGLGENGANNLDEDITALEKLIGDPLVPNQWEINAKVSALKAFRALRKREQGQN